jgi:hypothetical protein
MAMAKREGEGCGSQLLCSLNSDCTSIRSIVPPLTSHLYDDQRSAWERENHADRAALPSRGARREMDHRRLSPPATDSIEHDGSRGDAPHDLRASRVTRSAWGNWS